ncbi:MAG: hypothetical protein GXP27_04450 [Planctomycetes bacterium]|nr:hypothetical protein [Planctomycetota bacterium]
MSRLVLLALVMGVAIGCQDFQEAMEGGGQRKPTAPGGIASVDDVEAVGNAAGGGRASSATGKAAPARSEHQTASPKESAQPSRPSAKSAATEKTAAKRRSESPRSASKPVAQQAPKATKSRQSIIGKTTAKVVDAQKALKNPKIVVIENRLKTTDPLTVAASAYVSMAARASTFGFQRALQLFKATNGRNPTYQEFVKMMKENRVEFAALPPYQMYGYDAKTGGIVILEDKAKKIQLYKKHGIPIEPQDKKYE